MTTDTSNAKAILDGLLEYVSHLPGGKKQLPLEIVVLRGHLLIEAQLRSIVVGKFKREKAFDLSKLFAADVIRLAEALHGDELPVEVWEDLKQLNTIRNSLAHNLRDDTLPARIKKFVARFRTRDPETFKFVGESALEQLGYCIACLHTAMLKIRHAKPKDV